jgi:aminotransferase
MELPINPAVTNVAPSGIRRIFNLASDLSRQGRRVFPFHLGTPDFDTPDVIKAFAIQKLQEGFVHYAPNAGIPELRRLIARSVNQQRGTDYSEQSVIVTIGACEAISIALMAVMEPDSEVIVPTPCWMNYLMLPRILGARVVEVPTDPASFLPDAEQLRAHITPKTRAIMLNTPGNPTGVVIPPERLAAIVALARERGIWLLCDEVYEQIVYAGHAHHSPVSVPGAGDVCILIGGFSKTYSMTGWRLCAWPAARRRCHAESASVPGHECNIVHAVGCRQSPRRKSGRDSDAGGLSGTLRYGGEWAAARRHAFRPAWRLVLRFSGNPRRIRGR